MRFTNIAFTAALFAAGVLNAQDHSGGTQKSVPAKKKSAAKRKSTSSKSTASKAAVSKAPVKTAARRRRTSKSTKSTTTTASRSTARSTAKSKKPVATARRSTQREPTPERYKEIQQALAERGYFRGEPDGGWGAESVDALKRFQREQNLTEDGKLGSLTLIALGLGPKRAEPQEKASQQ